MALAQNGADKDSGQYTSGVNWAYTDGEGLLVVISSDSNFYCEDELGELLWLDWMEVTRPDGSGKYMDRGHFFTRAFYATLDEFFADECGLVTDESRIIAEGITHSTFNDNDTTGSRNGRNVWGFNISGTLYDYAGLCDDGMVDLNILRRWKLMKGADWPACWPDCVIPQVIKGPRLDCD